VRSSAESTIGMGMGMDGVTATDAVIRSGNEAPRRLPK
jgi:hypothetical protein